ncbi:MAG: sigma-70 family RNA polymerase sigma factor [Lentisphaerae bacterium]|nr:MAG: sigma-70 family RNA polymerase sigma factor [Lentisphaerota bacterium]
MQKPEVSDEELIAGYLAGDHARFEVLYMRYRKPVYSYLNRMIPGQPGVVDDIFQKTWIKVVNNLPRYQKKGSFLAWIISIARNSAMDHFRREAREKKDAYDSNVDYDNSYNPWQDMENAELAKLLPKLIEQLPADQKEVVLLRCQGVSFNEIAKIQDCSINTALGRMHYALNRLRKMVKSWQEKGEEVHHEST